MEEGKQSEVVNTADTQDQLSTKDSLMNVDEEQRSSGDGEEDRKDVGSFVPAQPTGIGDSSSLSSDSSENDSLRSRVPRVNCPEHIVSRNLAYVHLGDTLQKGMSDAGL